MLFALLEDVIARCSIFRVHSVRPAAHATAACAFAAADACECAGACETTAHTQANARVTHTKSHEPSYKLFALSEVVNV